MAIRPDRELTDDLGALLAALPAEIVDAIHTLPDASALIEVVLDLLVEERGAVNMLEFNQSPENLRQTLTHPLSNIISDGFYVTGRPHPRLHGTFAELLGGVCRERRWMDLPEAIRKITSRPAERFGLRGRGRIEPGYHADLVVFDPVRIGSPATYERPEQPPVGIHYVLCDGEFTFRRRSAPEHLS